MLEQRPNNGLYATGIFKFLWFIWAIAQLSSKLKRTIELEQFVYIEWKVSYKIRGCGDKS